MYSAVLIRYFSAYSQEHAILFCISFYYSVIGAFPSTISSYGVDIGTLMSRPDTSVVVIYIPSPRRTDIVHAVGVRLFQDKSVRQHKILRYRLSLQRLLLVIFKRVASDTRWNPSWPRCVLSSWSWWWSGLIHIIYTVLTAILLSAIDSLSSLICLISLQANPFTFVVIW